MAKKKYELTDEVLKHAGRVLHRIKAVSSFGDVKEGDLGGWVESEDNLSQEGECWLYGESKVYERARVSGDAVLSGEAEALGCALAFENEVVAWTEKDKKQFTEEMKNEMHKCICQLK